MNRNRILWTLLFAFFAYGQTTWAQWTGSGTETAPYQISTVDDWITLCTNVNKGTNTYKGKFFKLMADIKVEEEFFSAMKNRSPRQKTSIIEGLR